MSDDDWNIVLEGTHEAVNAFARVEIEALVRKMVYRFKRIKSSGIYGDDHMHKTLWDEYCHEVQEGPHDMLEEAWELTIAPVLNEIVEPIPGHLAVLLSIYAASEFDEPQAAQMVGSVWPDGIKRLVLDALGERAGWRDMYHFAK